MTAGFYPVNEMESLVTQAERSPLDDVRLTTPQRLFVSMSQRKALWRGGNQLGKSHALAYDIIHSARGTHPHRPAVKGPIRILVVSESWAQMDPLCRKLWDMLPKDEIDPRVRYEEGGGFRGFKEPRIPFITGPGAGSVIIFATYKQGSTRVAGGSFHIVYLDEPPPESVYGEILPRISRYHGQLRITMTPTPECPPQEYLRALVEKGDVVEMQTSLSAENITIRGGLIERPWKSQEQIDEDLAGYLDVERGMREHGDWDPVVEGRWLSAFSDELVTDEMPVGRLWVAIGIDHGAGAGRQAAELVVCSDDGERVWILDECAADGRTGPHDDAKAILDMLDRNPWIGGWKGVDYWLGDRAHGGDFYGNEKSNRDLLREMGRILGIPTSTLKSHGLILKVPYKQRGSMLRGFRLMNGLCAQKQLRVHPRCKRFIASAKEWAGRKEDPLKDHLDAARYPIERMINDLTLKPRLSTSAHVY